MKIKFCVDFVNGLILFNKRSKFWTIFCNNF